MLRACGAPSTTPLTTGETTSVSLTEIALHIPPKQYREGWIHPSAGTLVRSGNACGITEFCCSQGLQLWAGEPWEQYQGTSPREVRMGLGQVSKGCHEGWAGMAPSAACEYEDGAGPAVPRGFSWGRG